MEKSSRLHIAIILDGNRRYAKKLGLKPWQGHKFGAEKIKNLLEWCQELGIRELTLYAFSIDNFNRTDKEKKELFGLFERYFKELRKNRKLQENDINVRFIGRLGMFPLGMQKEMRSIMENTKENKKFRLNFAMAYSGKGEIADSVRKIIKKIKDKEIDEKEISEDLINENLYLTSNPDILIRPGGEKRISDFLLWQVSYAELFFLDKLWPEFGKEDLINIINEFKSRERRFGR